MPGLWEILLPGLVPEAAYGDGTPWKVSCMRQLWETVSDKTDFRGTHRSQAWHKTI